MTTLLTNGHSEWCHAWEVRCVVQRHEDRIITYAFDMIFVPWMWCVWVRSSCFVAKRGKINKQTGTAEVDVCRRCLAVATVSMFEFAWHILSMLSCVDKFTINLENKYSQCVCSQSHPANGVWRKSHFIHYDYVWVCRTRRYIRPRRA